MALAGLAALGPASADAGTWAVSNTTDTPVGQACAAFANCSLREAVTSTEANPGADAILIEAGTYPLVNGQLTITQTLSISRVGAGTTTIDGNDASRIFDVTGGIFTVQFLTLTGGHVDAGAGVGEGGAIRTAAGTELHVDSSTLTANSATGAMGARGGAISAQGDVFVERSVSLAAPALTGNAVTSSGGPADGGALAISGGEATFDSAVVNSNTADGASAHGGAIYGDGDVVIDSSTLSANHATGSAAFGGGIAATDGTTNFVDRTTFSSNTATGTGAGLRSGGGAFAAMPGASNVGIDVTRSTLAGNLVEITGSPSGATAAGGALYNDSVGSTQLTASTVTANAVAASGASTAQGAAFSADASGGNLGLAWSIVAENTGASQCAQAAFSSSGYNVLGSLTGCSGAPAGTDVTGVTDAGLSPLANHGGLTQTRLVVDPGSPALDLLPLGAGTCTVGQTDQRGLARPQGPACDAGAAESIPATLIALPTTLDWGNVPLSGAPAKTVTVSNTGDVTSVVPALGLAAPFSASGCAAGLPRSGSCSLIVRASPAAPGDFAATLSVTAGTASDTVDLHAVGFGPTTPPAISPSGAIAPGTVLTVADGAWTGSPTGFARQWVRCDADGASNCADLPGQTSTTYTTGTDDLGHRLRVRLVAHSATVDSDPVTTSPSGFVSAAPAKPSTPAPAPPPSSMPGDALVRCTGHELTILDFRTIGRSVAVRGLALSKRAGQQVTLRAGAKTVGTATVAGDGSFAATVTLPRSGARPRLTAEVGGSLSQAFAIQRRFTVVARKRAGNRVRITARVAGAKRGATVTLRRQIGCGRTARYGTARLGKGGTFTIALPLPTAADGVALYRAVSPIPGGRTYTLPIAVTAAG